MNDFFSINFDFTFSTYCSLLEALGEAKYAFQTFEEFVTAPKMRAVVLRHDVDRLPMNALSIAKIEHEFNKKATYFFRIVPNVWNEKIITQIIKLGHEISYHYEDLTIAKGNYEIAIQHFEKNLAKIRSLYPSKTICMHGSPMSNWDNRALWNKYDYHKYGILGEPYFDIDYSKVFYITDTGRAWNHFSANVRDLVSSNYHIPINNTTHLIRLILAEKLPNQIIINTHPHRWFGDAIHWTSELLIQYTKNLIKRIIIWAR